MDLSKEDRVEALERTLLEISALSAIYGGANGDEPSDSVGLTVESERELDDARHSIEEGTVDWDIPSINISISVRMEGTEQHSKARTARMQCRLPPGYPLVAMNVWVLAADGLNRSEREGLSSRLNGRAKELIGNESIMEIIQELQDAIHKLASESQPISVESPRNVIQKEPVAYGRRWIWVHHITNSDRRKDILREAQDLSLGGFLKAGYPGVIIVEGTLQACDAFIVWIKGNKSRPGGFGRNWGHHVRGEIQSSQRRLPEQFEEVADDMGVLGARCKAWGLEEEFRDFVLQHKTGLDRICDS